MSVGSDFFRAAEHRRAPVCSYRRHAACRAAVPQGGLQRAALPGTALRHQPCDKCFWFALTCTKCCHCYVKHSPRAFCHCAARSHPAVALNLHDFPQWVICAQKKTQISYLMWRKRANFAGRKLDVFLQLRSDSALTGWNKGQERCLLCNLLLQLCSCTHCFTLKFAVEVDGSMSRSIRWLHDAAKKLLFPNVPTGNLLR